MNSDCAESDDGPSDDGPLALALPPDFQEFPQATEGVNRPTLNP